METARSRPTFGTLPDELVSLIAHWLGLVERHGPPTSLTRLASVDKRFHSILDRVDNAALYAALFVDRYDVAAPARRFGHDAVTAIALAEELARRVSTLTRMRRQVKKGQLHTYEGGREQMSADLWLAYLMVLEHDGRNIDSLRKHAHIDSFVNLYFRDFLLISAADPGYPPETADRSVAAHLQFLLMNDDALVEETKEEAEIRFFVLKPFVVAAHKYGAHYAPWSMARLPPDASPSSGATYIHALNNSSTPCLSPVRVSHFGRELHLVPPIVAHAAVRAFFVRIEREPQRAGLFGFTPMGGFGNLQDPSHKAPLAASESSAYDLDFQRLIRCHGPRTSLGLPRNTFSGLVNGAWEGRFSFFDFDSYREMLAGRMRSLYEGPFGDQPQVWRIAERNVRLPSSFAARYALQDAQGIDALFAASASLPPLTDAEVARSADDPDVETLLLGESHSAWGTARLKGRVRHWDGLCVLIKEYIPAGGRGRWLYRGYIVQGDVMVGRWRDTFTPSSQIGYEGAFLMRRREEREETGS